MRRTVALVALAAALAGWGVAQERTGAVRLAVVPERADWTYAPGAPARFRVAATRDGHAVAGSPVKVACGPEQMPASVERSVEASREGVVVEAGTLAGPGFLRCVATATVPLKTANSKLRDLPKHAPNRARLGVLSQQALGGASAGVRRVRALFMPLSPATPHRPWIKNETPPT